jgi:hypothetical protein
MPPSSGPEASSKSTHVVALGRVDALYSVVLFVFACAAAAWFVSSNLIKRPYFYQETFAPAVMVACGHGFVQPKPEPVEMAEFLELIRPNFRCEDLPPGTDTVAPNMFQSVHRYLMTVVGVAWRALGISWTSLQPLYALIYGVTTVLAYLLFRSVMSRPLAFLCAGLMLTAPVQLFNLPHLRDYAKAPFMLALVAMLAWGLRTGRFGWSGWLGISAATGLFLGIGIGFRIDVITFAPLFLMNLFLFTPGALSANIGKKIQCSAMLLLAFLPFGLPILHGMSSGSNLPHVILLGMMGEFDGKLGLKPAFYEIGYHYLDMYVNTLVTTYAQSLGYEGGGISYPSQIYDRFSGLLIIDLVRHFPADIAVRFLGAAWQTLHLPFRAYVTFEDVYFFYDHLLTPESLGFAYHRVWDYVLAGALGVSLLALARHSIKLTLATFVVVAYLIGYPFLQFGVRHYFYLQIIGLWFCGLACQVLITLCRSVAQRNGFAGSSLPQAATCLDYFQRIAIVLVGCVVLPIVVLQCLRIYQSKRELSFFERHYNAPSVALNTKLSETAAGVLIAPASLFPNLTASPESGDVRMAFLVADFDRRACGHDTISVKYSYEFLAGPYDFNRRTSIPIDDDTRLVFPVFYRNGEVRFNGLEIARDERSCLLNLKQLGDTAGLTFPMTIRFSKQWRADPLFRELAGR